MQKYTTLLKKTQRCDALGGSKKRKSSLLFPRWAKIFRHQGMTSKRKRQTRIFDVFKLFLGISHSPKMFQAAETQKRKKASSSVCSEHCDLSHKMLDLVGNDASDSDLQGDDIRKHKHARTDQSQISQAVNLTPFDRTATFEKLDHSGFTHVRRVSKGINGDIYKYQWRRGSGDTFVAVKMLKNQAIQASKNKEMDEEKLHFRPRPMHSLAEDALAEIGVLTYLKQQVDLPPYLLKMLGVFSDGQFTWLVTEFASGGELFDVAQSGNLSPMRVQRYTRQLFHAVDYLHKHYIGHRDISLENTLLKDDVVKVMDFGASVRTHSSSGQVLRYFLAVGKDFYRAPECYVPPYPRMTVKTPLDPIPNETRMLRVDNDFLCEVKLPAECSPGQHCSVDVLGYTAAPLDVFAVGICMFMMAFQCLPWSRARPSDALFTQYSSKGIDLKSMLTGWGKELLEPAAMLMLEETLKTDPASRPCVHDCLGCDWLSDIVDEDADHKAASSTEVSTI
jgi:serine/threonine protein kinase